MDKDSNNRLTSAEIASLWTTYMNDSLSVCLMRHFLETVEDREIRSIIKYTLSASQGHLRDILQIFTQEKLPVPQGLTVDDDVSLEAPPLFTDTFAAYHLLNMAKLGVYNYGSHSPQMSRSDTRDFFSRALAEIDKLHNLIVELMISKGIYIKPPYVSVPEEASYVHKQSFMGSWTGEKRPLLAAEIQYLFSNLQTNTHAHKLLTGFAQVTGSKEIRKYLLRGKDIASRHADILSGILEKEDIPATTTWDTGLTNSTDSPFSDKLMLFHVLMLSSNAIANMGCALAASFRKDLAAVYVRLTSEVGTYVEDGLNIMIGNEWLEQPPQAVNHENLARV